jgi:hypothetical protein
MTRAGPPILELCTFFTNSFWVKVHLPVPATSEPLLLPGPKVTVNGCSIRRGRNYRDAGNTFEIDQLFGTVREVLKTLA